MRRVLLSIAALASLAVLVLGIRRWLLASPYGDHPMFATALEGAPALAPRDAAKRKTNSTPERVSVPSATAQYTPALPIRRARQHQTPPLTDTKNYLLVGIDRRPGARYGGLADTIMIAVIDERSGHIGLVSVPRDLYVDIPGHGAERINATLGLARALGERPLKLLGRVIEDTLALPISHAIAVDLGVLERAVDALGGITIEVPCPIIDNFHDSRTETGWRKLAVDAGPQHLEGITAAMYARSRHGRTDWNRARRQQAVLLGMRDRFLSIDGMTKLPELWDEFESAIATDMRRIDVFRLARRIARTDAAHLHGLVLGHVQTETHRTEAGRSVLLPNYEAIDLALSKLFSAPLPGTPPRHAECEPADVALKASAHGKAAAHADPAAAEAAARSLPVSAAALPATAR